MRQSSTRNQAAYAAAYDLTQPILQTAGAGGQAPIQLRDRALLQAPALISTQSTFWQVAAEKTVTDPTENSRDIQDRQSVTADLQKP